MSARLLENRTDKGRRSARHEKEVDRVAQERGLCSF